jgi:hypothetical protein
MTFPAQNGQKGSGVKMEDSYVHKGPGKVDPLLALELRLRWLEALIVGMKQETGKDRKGKATEEYAGVNAAASLKHGETLTRMTEMVQTQLGKVVEGNEGLKKFMDNCMCNYPSCFPLPLTLLVLVNR